MSLAAMCFNGIDKTLPGYVSGCTIPESIADERVTGSWGHSFAGVHDPRMFASQAETTLDKSTFLDNRAGV